MYTVAYHLKFIFNFSMYYRTNYIVVTLISLLDIFESSYTL